MILMYCYSTYKFSPVGFAIGNVLVPITSGARFTELKPCKDSFVKSCFENGLIKSVYGKYPKNGHYLFMAPDIKSEFINEDGVPSHKIGNFLFEFTGEDEYKRFVKNYNKSKLAAAMNEFIVPDSFAETFALKMDTNKLNNYISSMLEGTSDSSDAECNDLYFKTTSSDKKTGEELTRIAGCTISEVQDLLYSSKKKLHLNKLTNAKTGRGLLTYAGLAALLILGIWAIVKLF